MSDRKGQMFVPPHVQLEWSAYRHHSARPPNPDNNKNRDDKQDQALPSDWMEQNNFWSGKTYDKARAQSSLKPVPANLPSKGDEDSKWSEHLHPHNYSAKAPSLVSSSKSPLSWTKGIRTNLTTHQIACSPTNPNDSNNIGLCITKITTISKEAFATLD